jgi:hypothetical protein
MLIKSKFLIIMLNYGVIFEFDTGHNHNLLNQILLLSIKPLKSR